MLYTNDFNSIPFELKIGLLKFICDDVGLRWVAFLLAYDRGVDELDKFMAGEKFDLIKKIIPKEFLKSIL